MTLESIKTPGKRIKIPENIDFKNYQILLELRSLLPKENILEKEDVFLEFLGKFLTEKNIQESSINGVKFENGTVSIYTKDGKNHDFAFLKFIEYVEKKNLGGVDVKSLELESKTIEIAMESIFLDNSGVFDEVDETDVFDVERAIKLIKKGKIKGLRGKSFRETKELFGKYAGKNLLQLRESFDQVNQKLLKHYEINKNTQKSLNILESKIEFYAGIGDTYEGGARLFGAKTSEVDRLTTDIVSQKSVKELLYYIIDINKKISENSYYSDMAKAANLGVVKFLTQKTFEKMKSENASKRDFVNFARAITGRQILGVNGKILKSKNVKVDADFEQKDIANKALLHLMFQENGIVDEITEFQGKKIKLVDEFFTPQERKGTVGEIIKKTIGVFETLDQKQSDVLSAMGLDKDGLANKKIQDLSFNEMLALGAFYRISKGLQKANLTNSSKTPEQKQSIIRNINNEALQDAFTKLNEDFEENFEASFWTGDWDGKDSADFGLTGDSAEAFDLYGEINGRGFFELADDNFISKNILTKQTGVVAGVGMLTAMLILTPAVMASTPALLAAGAVIGGTTTIASQLMDKKGYDTVKEAGQGIATQATIDIVVSTLFTAASGTIISNATKWLGKAGVNNFSSRLSKDIASGTLSENTKRQLGQFVLEGTEQLSKQPNNTVTRFFRILSDPKLNQALRKARTMNTTKIDKATANYISKYISMNSFPGDMADMLIGIGDGIFASFLWQAAQYIFINQNNKENHYDTDTTSYLEQKNKSQTHKI